MLNYIIEVSICWLGFYILYYFFLRGETFFKTNRIYLLSTTLLGLMIPLLEMPYISSSPSAGLMSNYLEPITVGVKNLEYSIEEIVVTPMMEASAFSIHSLLIIFYWAGVLIFFSRFLIGISQIGRLYINGQRHAQKGYTLIKTQGYHLPFSFFNCLFWSTSFETDASDEEKILLHELAHIRGAHSLDVILMEFLKITLWCSPLIYFYKKELQNIHEYLADSEVLQTTAKKPYGQLLLRHAQSGRQLALANHFIHSQLKKRIQMMTKNKSARKALTKYLLAIPVLIVMILLFSNNEVMAKLQDHSSASLTDMIPLELNAATDTSIADVFKVVEQMPQFPGCEEVEGEMQKKCAQKKMLEFIYKNIRYPKTAMEANIEGTVVVRFIVDKSGAIRDATILREIGGGCGEEAKKTIEAMPTWIPGKQKGKAVNVYYNLPIKFRLEGPSKKGDPLKELELSTDKRPLFVIDGVIGNGYKHLKPEDIETIEVLKDQAAIDSYGEEARNGVIVITTKNKAESTSKEGLKRASKETARFPGCEDITDPKERTQCSNKKLLTFIYSNIRYPKAAAKEGIQGTVVVKFLIDKEGNITERKIIRGIGGGCDEEVLRVVDSMEDQKIKWIPAAGENGKKLSSYFTLPVKFKLAEDEVIEDKPKEGFQTQAFKNDLKLETIKVFPNPSKGYVNLSFQGPKGQVEVRVTDINGKVIFNEVLNQFDGIYNTQLDLNKAAKGNMILSIYQGEKVYSEKLIIH